MLKWFANLPVRKRVGILAIILGIIAIFLGDPYDRAQAKVNLKDVAYMSLENMNKISPLELAHWIIQGKADFRLIDLRNEKEYNSYFIPTAENINPVKILESDLARNEKIVLYSSDDLTAAKTWFILKSKKYKSVYILKGGIKGWQQEILFPRIPKNASVEEEKKFNEIAEVSKFFGGRPSMRNSSNNEEINLPKIKAPKRVVVKRSKHKKKREGC